MPKGKHNGHVKGSKHYRWNKGCILSSHGYVKIRVGIDHRLADPNGYAYEHLLVWVSDGRPVPREDKVFHHINGDKTDNRLQNLEVLHRATHNQIHLPRRDPKTGRFVGKKAAGRLLDGKLHEEYPG